MSQTREYKYFGGKEAGIVSFEQAGDNCGAGLEDGEVGGEGVAL
jgi:hypothetical protein